MCKCKSTKDSKLVKRLATTVSVYLLLCVATICLFPFKAEKPCCCHIFFVTLVIFSVVCFMLVLIFMRLYNDEREEELRNRN